MLKSLRAWGLIAVAAYSLAGDAAAQEAEEEQPYLPGLIATLRGDKDAVQRIDEALPAQWIEPSDVRLPGVQNARWKGFLRTQTSGEYRLHVSGSGPIEIRLAGKSLKFREEGPEWRTSEPVTLSADYHPLDIYIPSFYRSFKASFLWSGPQFGVEPIAPRFLWHDRTETIEPAFERGQVLNEVLGCTACHARRTDPSRMDAPSLVQLHGNLQRQWLIDWLMQDKHAAISADAEGQHEALWRHSRRMPLYGLARQQAEAIATFLLADRGDLPKENRPSLPPPLLPAGQTGSNAKKKIDKEAEKKVPSAAEGERLFLTLGCLACHQRGNLGESGLFGGGDLTTVAAKRPADFFSRWLANPAGINRRHRMPVFELADHERISLSLYLTKQDAQQQTRAEAKRDDAAESQVAIGRELVKELRCGSCHELPESQHNDATFAQTLLDDNSDWSQSCAGSKADARSGWGHDLPKEFRRWLQAYFRFKPMISSSASDAILKNNCLACHAREGFVKYTPLLPTQLADKLAEVGEKHEELAALIPAMTPPSLNGVGDKLDLPVINDAIRRSKPPHRPYLLVRMPKFPLNYEVESALSGYFWTMDQVPRSAPTAKPATDLSESALAAAGGRLVSTDGFGCVSCHQIGSVVPDKAPLNARGPALSQIDKRIRREWFDRFVADPSRIVPRMEMPSVRIPVKGVLGDKVDTQLAAVWHVLSTPGFQPPEPNPVRVLRRSGIAAHNEPPLVMNDVVKMGDRALVQPLVIGLPNRQNFLYNLSEGRLAAWWLGDMARQRTRGKSWHWEVGGPLVLESLAKRPELAILRGDERLLPQRLGQHVAELRGYQLREENVQFSYDLHLGIADDPSVPATRVHVSEVWRPVSLGPGAKVTRELTATWQAQEGDRLVCELVPAAIAGSAVAPDQIAARLKDGTVELAGDRSTWSLNADGIATGPRAAAGETSARITLAYAPLIAPDTIDAPQLSFPADADTIEIAPGFAGRRLPLPGDVMPTALAWRGDPTAPGKQELVIGSLKGQVVAASDSDNDGLEDAATVVADGLATPYGIADGGDSLHVLTKSALLEIQDGAVNVLASGWGHTDDYHDWAVGLPRTAKGEYFVGLPCQQDERSAAAAKHRGAMLKLVPRKPTADDPRRYEIQVVSTGHRFPMGLALSRDEELFVTDNQGNYNPFNELNHVRPGAFFGFINALEKKDKSFTAPPLVEPAIDIPHPWTRSVNGICFLDSPTSRSIFGPLEGHLIGCEYDTRRLVRMSLQKVGDTWQGAAYPLNLEPSSPENGLLGPIVCAVSPRGELYVGNIRDSGWGAGNNIGEVVQVKIEPENLAAGIAEVRAVAGGFEMEFFRPVDEKKAADPGNYVVSSYRRESTPAYGGSDLDRRLEKIARVEVAPDRRRATLSLTGLREGFVYELQLKNLTSDGNLFHPTEAHYTLRRRVE